MTSSSPERVKVGVLGGGAWGTALAIHCSRMGHATTMWAREEQVVSDVNGPDRENKTFLKDHRCPPLLTATGSMEECVRGAELILSVVPTQFVEETLSKVAHMFDPNKHIIVSCSKGLTTNTLETVSEVLMRVLPPALHPRLSYLSGPTSAAEVAAELLTAATIAAEDDATAARVQALLTTPRFRCYRTRDVTGVELGGALKNVVAIASGISDGLAYGNNCRAALITRGLYEMTKLAKAKGANPLTLSGLAGMGDLVVTCTVDSSRNRIVGLRLGRGDKLADIMESLGVQVAEGVPTSLAAFKLASKLGVECPIMESVYRVVHVAADCAAELTGLMNRDLQRELGG